MRKQLFFSLIYVLILVPGLCQEKAIVLHTYGKVSYLPEANAAAQRLYPGLEILPKGTVMCSEGAAAKFLFNKQVFEYKGPGNYNVGEMASQSNNKSSMGFLGRFFNFITDGMDNTKSDEDLEKYHRRYMSSIGGGIKGYAESDSGLQPISLTTGVIAESLVDFAWRKKDSALAYRFEVLRESDRQLLFRAITRDTLLTLNFESLVFDQGENYVWNVVVENSVASSQQVKLKEGNAEGESAEVRFTYNPGLKSDIVESLEKNREFKQASPSEKELMLAVAFENKELYYTADRTFREAIVANPDNLLVQKAYAFFLAQRGLLQQALTQNP